jgi:hypothetical protein
MNRNLNLKTGVLHTAVPLCCDGHLEFVLDGRFSTTTITVVWQSYTWSPW